MLSDHVLLILFSTLLLSPAFSADTEECRPDEYNGFMQNMCYRNNTFTHFKCITSNATYTIGRSLKFRKPVFSVSQICANDTFMYQSCGVNSPSVSTFPGMLCGVICPVKDMMEVFEITDTSFCSQQELNSCRGTQHLGILSHCSVKTHFCDGVATHEEYSTDLERQCNGYTYALTCNDGQVIDAEWVTCIDKYSVTYTCADGSRGDICSHEHITGYCESHMYPGHTIPLFNFSRCGMIGKRMTMIKMYRTSYAPICVGYRDQTNCSDVTRVALSCDINGYHSTVSRQVICNPNLRELIDKPLCDDGIDQECKTISMSCTIHKHQYCDGRIDCPDKSDEMTCTKLTKDGCLRRYSNFMPSPNLAIPVLWIRDGVVDCLNSRDEHGEWPTCGAGRTLRYSSYGMPGSGCEEVFLCRSGLVEFSDLCDGKYSCERELTTCTKSRILTGIVTSPPEVNRITMLAHCLLGLQDLDREVNGQCAVVEFSHESYEVFGKTTYPRLYVPQGEEWRANCDYMYGGAYVYISCLGGCIDSPCVLTNPLTFDMCHGMYSDRVISLSSKLDHLSFLWRDRVNGGFTNEVFPCKNGKCIAFNKVCDLVNDCDDHSDETHCTNHFKCRINHQYMPLSKVCDKKIDCIDLSDECNEYCNQEMIDSLHIKVLAWTLGLLACCLNIVTIPNTIVRLFRCKSLDSLMNRTLLLFVSFGDLLVGLYIVLIVVYNAVYGPSYCIYQLEWLTSTACSMVGVLSSVGQLVSLLSMTLLSFVRAMCLSKNLHVPLPASRNALMKMLLLGYSIVCAAGLFSCLPLVGYLEDYFVNGIFHGKENPLLVGAPDKRDHIEILSGYYGRFGSTSFSWSRVRKMISDMFSRDYTGIEHIKLQFYGNDAACIFKYFVTMDDPQFGFVLSFQVLTVTCMFCIIVSYISIGKVTSVSYPDVADKGTRKVIKQRNKAAQRKVAIIILTDFSCWVPFIVVCILHSTKVIDATAWYSIFSLVINPLNSVINPLILNPYCSTYISRFLATLKSEFRSNRVSVPAATNIELSVSRPLESISRH